MESDKNVLSFKTCQDEIIKIVNALSRATNKEKKINNLYDIITKVKTSLGSDELIKYMNDLTKGISLVKLKEAAQLEAVKIIKEAKQAEEVVNERVSLLKREEGTLTKNVKSLKQEVETAKKEAEQYENLKANAVAAKEAEKVLKKKVSELEREEDTLTKSVKSLKQEYNSVNEKNVLEQERTKLTNSLQETNLLNSDLNEKIKQSELKKLTLQEQVNELQGKQLECDERIKKLQDSAAEEKMAFNEKNKENTIIIEKINSDNAASLMEEKSKADAEKQTSVELVEKLKDELSLLQGEANAKADAESMKENNKAKEDEAKETRIVKCDETIANIMNMLGVNSTGNEFDIIKEIEEILKAKEAATTEIAGLQGKAKANAELVAQAEEKLKASNEQGKVLLNSSDDAFEDLKELQGKLSSENQRFYNMNHKFLKKVLSNHDEVIHIPIVSSTNNKYKLFPFILDAKEGELTDIIKKINENLGKIDINKISPEKAEALSEDYLNLICNFSNFHCNCAQDEGLIRLFKQALGLKP